LETIQYGEKQELYELENSYIIKHNSITNGYNYRRHYIEDYVQVITCIPGTLVEHRYLTAVYWLKNKNSIVAKPNLRFRDSAW
jgi:hypothetical protein